LSAEVGACSWIGCDRAEDRLDSLMPCPIPSSSGGGCLENYNPSDSMPSENEIEPAQAQHDLDGAWELMSNHHSRSLVRDKFSVFVIAGDALTLKDKKSYRIELGQEPNTMLFGDSLFEVVANGIAWLHCMQSRGCVCYRKVDLPTPQFLFSIQGAWEYCGGRLGTSAQTLTMQGPWWHLFDGYESSRGLVRLSGFTGTPVLKDYRIHTDGLRSSASSCAWPAVDTRRVTQSLINTFSQLSSRGILTESNIPPLPPMCSLGLPSSKLSAFNVKNSGFRFPTHLQRRHTPCFAIQL